MPANRTYPNLPAGFRVAMAAARKEKGWNQRQLSEEIGVIKTLVSQYESGARNIRYEHAKKINEVLNLCYVLPEPDLSKAEPIHRKPRKSRKIKDDPFVIVVEGEAIEVLVYRKVGEVRGSQHLRVL